MDRNLGTTGYVMIPRALLLKAFDEHHEASGDMEAFLRILTYVNYAEAVVRRVNTNVVCARGESVISYSHWAEILGWSLGRTRRYFMRLVAEGNIEQVKGDCASHIRIPGYDVWTGKSQTGKRVILPWRKASASSGMNIMKPPVWPGRIGKVLSGSGRNYRRTNGNRLWNILTSISFICAIRSFAGRRRSIWQISCFRMNMITECER